MPPRFPIIIGPTAGGKSDLAIQVAQQLNDPHPSPPHSLTPSPLPAAEILTADAFQIFRGLDIGTAKPTLDQRAGIPHHLTDLVDPRERFSVHDWLTLANTTIADIRSRRHTPIVVGGTHLYIKALLDGLFDGPALDPAFRATLNARPLADLRAELERIDPRAAARIHPNDLRRTVRALEVFHLTGTPISAHQKQWDRSPTQPSGTGFQPVSPSSTSSASSLSSPPSPCGAGVPPAPNASSDPPPSRAALAESPADFSRPAAMSSFSAPAPDRLLIGLDWPAELLNPRINTRVKSMLDQGLVEEARRLWESGAFGAITTNDQHTPHASSPKDAESEASSPKARIGRDEPSDPSLHSRTRSDSASGSSESAGATETAIPLASANQSREALGYKQLIDHFEGRCTLDEAIEKIKIETRRFAKNQRTWLRRLRTTPNSIWIDAATTPQQAWPAIVLRALSGPPAPAGG